MGDPYKIAQAVLTAAGQAAQNKLYRLPATADLEELARAYLALVPAPDAKRKLSDLGAVYVSETAAKEFHDAPDSFAETIEGARRELTAIMLDGKEMPDGSWRSRSRTTSLDVTARAVVEGRLAVVTHAHTRLLGGGRRR